MAYFEYTCPHCSAELEGSFGDDVECTNCNLIWETDWDYVQEDTPASWLLLDTEQTTINTDLINERSTNTDTNNTHCNTDSSIVDRYIYY